MQFKVPQNVQREDHIVGPLTLRQLIICGAGGGLAYTVYVGLGKDYHWITWFPPVAFITLLTILFAFIRPLDLSFARFLLTYLEFALLPQKRSWTQGSAEILMSAYASSPKPKSKIEEKAEEKAKNIEDKTRKIMELSKMLDNHSIDR